MRVDGRHNRPISAHSRGSLFRKLRKRMLFMPLSALAQAQTTRCKLQHYLLRKIFACAHAVVRWGMPSDVGAR